MSQEVLLSALARHIEDALRREDLPPRDVARFRERLVEVHAARARLTANAVKAE
jgi:hypothetical protein